MRQSQCWDLTLSVTVTGAAWLPLLFTASTQSHGGGLGRLLPWGPCTCLLLSWWKAMKKKMCFSHCFFDFIIVCDSQTSGLGADWGVGETRPSWHRELCHPMSMADVPPGSSRLLCHHCFDGFDRFGINIRHVSIISTDSVARWEMLIINYWSWHLR